MKKLLFIICLLFPIGFFAFAKTDPSIVINKIPAGGVLLDKGWKFHEGDNPVWADRNVDDNSWQKIDPSKDIYYLPQIRTGGTWWFRLKLHVSPVLFGKTLGMVAYQTGVSDVYLNGKLLYHLGNKADGDKTVTSRFYDEQLSLPLDTGAVQELAVRFSCGKNNLLINYLTPNYCFRLVLTNVDKLLGTFMIETTSYLVKDIVLVSLYIILGVISLSLYISYRVQRAYLIFGVYCVISIIQALLRVPTYAVKPVDLYITSACHLLSHLTSLVAIVLLLEGLYKLYGQNKTILFYFLIFYSITTLPVFIFFYPWSNIYAVGIAPLVSADASFINLRAIRSGFSNAWILFVTFLVFFLVFITFMLIAASGNINLGLNIAALSLLVIPLGLSIFLANEFARTGRDLQTRIADVQRLSEKAIQHEQEKQQLLTSQNETLEKKVSERTAALNKSLHDLRSTQDQLIHSEKMASLGQLTAGIAHEIQNPLNFVNNFSEVNQEMIDEMEQEIKSGNIDDALAIAASIKQNEQKISHHGKRADGIVKGMLQHSRSSNGEKQLTNINTLADEFMHLSYHGLRAKDKSFHAEMLTHFDRDLPKINIVQQDIGRVLLNLFNNAFYAVNQKQKSAGADYKPEVVVITSSDNGLITIKIRDNGIGIPASIKDKIMQPFFTTKPTGEGTGLGLSLSYDTVVKGHGGNIAVNTKDGEFTEFIIELPVN
ncbi:MAG TPA: ATP-binding protein [Mucilaginibacter sp.]|jgi:signal transduction histidine kinase